MTAGSVKRMTLCKVRAIDRDRERKRDRVTKAKRGRGRDVETF